MKKYTPCDNRSRVVLQFKRDVVYQYLEFLKAPRTEDSTDHDSSDDESKEANQVRTIKNFLSRYNRDKSPDKKLLHGCVFKWFKSFERGEMEDWNGMNPLSNPNAKAKKIMEYIYHALKVEEPATAHFNKIVQKSKISPEKYGVVAKRFISKGTFLGFFKGKYITPPEDEMAPVPVVLDGFHMYLLSEYSYIDGRDFTSCFARYYAWSGDVQVQNVSVHKLDVWTNPNRAIGFMANKDIAKGEELVIPLNQDYVIRKIHKSFVHAPCGDNELTAQAKADLFV